VLNDVIREWLVSENDVDRLDGAFLTGEFRIVQNLDLIKGLRAHTEVRTDPAATYDAQNTTASRPGCWEGRSQIMPHWIRF
jgi:hypothetical protein